MAKNEPTYIDTLVEMTDTAKRKNSFFNYSTLFYNTSEVTFFLLAKSYQKSGKKGQAIFLNEAYIQSMTQSPHVDFFVHDGLNLHGALDKRRSSFTRDISEQVNAVGKTTREKIKRDGFLDFVNKKISGDPTGIRTDIFDDVLMKVAENIVWALGADTGKHGAFNSDREYQPNAAHKMHLSGFRSKLKTVGFDPGKLGIY